MYKALYLDEVQNDVNSAKRWYTEQQEGLDARFATAVKETLLNILKTPLIYAVRYKNVRIAHTKKFPYNIHFYLDETTETVVITGIVHNRRNDALYLDRQ